MSIFAAKIRFNMAKKTEKKTRSKQDDKELAKNIDRERKILLELLLKKAGVTYNDVVEHSLRRWVAGNLDLLTDADRKQFKYLHV